MRRTFDQFAVVDWSGAKGPKQKGIAVAFAGNGDAPPAILEPLTGGSRKQILEWLKRLSEARANVIVGLDLSPALPFVDEGAYFPGWDRSPDDAKDLWALVDELSSDDPHFASSSFVDHDDARKYLRRDRDTGEKFGARPGGRLRACEWAQQEAGLSPYSCHNLVGAAQVGKSSFTGMRVLHALDGKIPVWPFDPIPKSGPLIVEIYTSLAAREAGVRKGRSKTVDPDELDSRLSEFGSRPHVRRNRYDDHVTDALLTTAWLRRAASEFRRWNPDGLTPQIARTEGWTFGVV